MSNIQLETCLTINIKPEFHALAKQFAIEQDSQEKGKQVYLNTLAILAVNDFLEWMHIVTDLASGDSWNLVFRYFSNVADLVIPNLGKLECRPVLPGETVINLPSEITEDRIAYVAVQFHEQLNEVQLLGFVPVLDKVQTQIKIDKLEPIEELIDYLFSLELDVASAISSSTTTSENLIINLSEWLENIENIVASGWQTLDSYLRNQPENLVFRFATAPRSRSGDNQQQISVSGVEEIQITEHSLVLVINCKKESECEQIRDIRLRLYPKGESKYLPMGLKLIVLDEVGEVFIEAQAREADNWIQLEFTGEPQETFGVQVILNDTIFTKNFVI